MLSMKTLGVAVTAAVLSALIAPGSVLAQPVDYNLDAPAAAKPAPILYALETLPGGARNCTGRPGELLDAEHARRRRYTGTRRQSGRRCCLRAIRAGIFA